MAPHPAGGTLGPEAEEPTAEMSRMAADRVQVVWGHQGLGTMFGSMARRMIRRAASRRGAGYDVLLLHLGVDRVVGRPDEGGMSASVMAIRVLNNPGPRMATTMMASSREGWRAGVSSR